MFRPKIHVLSLWITSGVVDPEDLALYDSLRAAASYITLDWLLTVEREASDLYVIEFENGLYARHWVPVVDGEIDVTELEDLHKEAAK